MKSSLLSLLILFSAVLSFGCHGSPSSMQESPNYARGGAPKSALSLQPMDSSSTRSKKETEDRESRPKKPGEFNTEAYDKIYENPFMVVKDNPLSTFSIDVDTASYTKDSTLEKLADKGNGNYGYIDNFQEAKKMFVHQLGGTLITIAKDVKIQIEFNPAVVTEYRLIGYENRLLQARDFNDDTKDAGEIGAGHTVTALYEVTLAPNPLGEGKMVDPLKYQTDRKLSQASKTGEMLTFKVRYKEPDGEKSKLLKFGVVDQGKKWRDASGDFKFAASVASFGMILRDSKHRGKSTFALVLELAQEGKGEDPQGYREEFINLVKKARDLKGEGVR